MYLALSAALAAVYSDINLAGVMDLRGGGGYAEMQQHHFLLTVDMINDKSDGFFDEYCVSADSGDAVPCTQEHTQQTVQMTLPTIRTTLSNSACDENAGAAAYWEVRPAACGSEPLHGVIGCRCSGASMAVARIAGLEHVPQISASSTSPKLSNTDDFPYFFRTVAPDGPAGTLGALIQLFREFDWDTLTILHTDKAWASSTAAEFVGLWAGTHAAQDDAPAWTGSIEYQHSIDIDANGHPVAASVEKALKAIETEKNSRVIFLIAHSEDAPAILKQAVNMNFQPDSVWVGPGSWPGEMYPDADWKFPSDSWVPGYLGLVPFRNDRSIYNTYLSKLSVYESANGLPISTHISQYGAETADAVVAMAIALNSLPADQRNDGSRVKEVLRSTSFAGVSGDVRFDENGDRADPLFTVLNLGPKEGNQWAWSKVGYVGVRADQNRIDKDRIWWVGADRAGSDVPPDQYPVPEPEPDHTALIIVIVAFVAVICCLCVLYFWDRKQKIKRKAKRALEAQNKLANLEKSSKDKLKQALAEQAKALELKKNEMTFPPEWELEDRAIEVEVRGETKHIRPPKDGLFEVSQESEEYWDVFESMLKKRPNAENARTDPQTGQTSDVYGMQDAWITKLQRVQNPDLYTYYDSQKKRIARTPGAVEGTSGEVKQVRGWHGTGGFPAENIYNDRQDGFMMQFASEGQWGRGLYFAEDAGYSHFYASPANPQQNDLREGEREMMLASIITGNTIEMDRDDPQMMRRLGGRLNGGTHGSAIKAPPFLNSSPPLHTDGSGAK